MNASAIGFSGAPQSFSLVDDFAQQQKLLQGKLNALRSKILTVQPSERLALAPELNDLQFEMMDLESLASSDQNEQALLSQLRQELDEVGKSIASFSPPKKDDLIPSLVCSALSGAAFTLAASAANSLLSKTVTVENRPQAETSIPEQEPFDRTNLHHQVGDNGLVLSSAIYKPAERAGDPAQMSEPLITLVQNQPPQDAAGIEEYLARRGMQLADAKQCSVFLCSRKITVTDLENQKAALVAAEKAMQDAQRALQEAQKNTADAFDKAVRDVNLNIGAGGAPVTVNGGILCDFPPLVEAKLVEERLAFEYNKSVVVFGQQRTQLSKLERKINGDSNDSWTKTIIDLLFGFFGFSVSRDF